MSTRHTKITIDLFMVFAVTCSYIRWDGEPTLHIVAGFICAILFTVHFYMNRKVFAAFSKGVKRLSTPARIKYFTDCLLLATWSIAVISGLLALLSYSGVTEISFDIRRFHGLFCRIGGVLIVIHMIQHGRQIISYLKARDNSAMQ